MKLLTGFVVVVILAGASGADAMSWPWKWVRTDNRNGKLPKPIDSPVVRPKLKAEKATRSRHPSKYQRQGWGAEWDKTLNVRHAHEGNHSIFIRE